MNHPKVEQSLKNGDEQYLDHIKNILEKGQNQSLHFQMRYYLVDGVLSERDVKVWDASNTRSYLDSIGFTYREEVYPDEFIHTLGDDNHIHLNHIDALKIQLQRKPKQFPTLTINREVKSIDFNFSDFILSGYVPYPKISMDIAV